jgi:hypothetical protein
MAATTNSENDSAGEELSLVNPRLSPVRDPSPPTRRRGRAARAPKQTAFLIDALEAKKSRDQSRSSHAADESPAGDDPEEVNSSPPRSVRAASQAASVKELEVLGS